MSRSPPKRRKPRVTVIGTQRGCVIRGKTWPFAEVEALNLSVIPSERVRPTETFVIAKADANGHFAGRLPMRVHDLVRLRARAASGVAGKSMTFRARGIAGRARPPRVATFRIGLRDMKNGTIRVFNINPARPLAEPGATLTLTNLRTDESLPILMNANGSLKGKIRVPGRAGDELRVECVLDRGPAAVRGGAVGDIFDAGSLLVPSPEKLRPRDHDDGALVATSGFHQKIGFIPTLKQFRAPLFRQRGKKPDPYDVFQSELANCYIASAAAAVAHVAPTVLADAIIGLGKGRYRVTFKVVSKKKTTTKKKKASYVARRVVVTSHLYVRPSGGLLYGSTSNQLGMPPTSLWWPVLEKAIAKLKGSYKKIGRGGCSHHILETLMGRPARHFYSDQLEPEAMWTELTRTMAARLPLVVGTFPLTSVRKYRRTGLYPDHAYTVLSCREVRGVRKIGLRNPWGEDVERPGTPRKNGYFEIDFARFSELIEVISTVR